MKDFIAYLLLAVVFSLCIYFVYELFVYNEQLRTALDRYAESPLR